MTRQVTWTAPYPEALAELLADFHYRPGWSFQLIEGSRDDGHGEVTGLALIITSEPLDAQDPSRSIPMAYPFVVPPEVHSAAGWEQWLWLRIGDAERHERGEHFRVGEARPFAPDHEPCADGYWPRPTARL
ncbi:hypothetical protein I5G61_gp34 [Mycobacterium phage Quesadilla]|uniref:Uncharacterized protein n=1 Tax=Mycobacterium phage Quesadilla TaxID=2664226 RepID=A0A5Q2WBZ3_9CAUD|nr:hypothetical protein I5G61_gp34 [Mycobacterium phage Quesadilla]QGH75282.1 hypothetical protein SEA_QUESADILLA_34 [Mycobacterium phage Quesadilla]